MATLKGKYIAHYLSDRIALPIKSYILVVSYGMLSVFRTEFEVVKEGRISYKVKHNQTLIGSIFIVVPGSCKVLDNWTWIYYYLILTGIVLIHFITMPLNNHILHNRVYDCFTL
jgi:hypothetical protein